MFFPYDYLYEEQLRYMQELKAALDAKGHCLLEMPTGTGKTVCLLALITSYQLAHPEMGKLIYCTRTVPEMSKCAQELKRVIRYREQCIGAEGGKVLAVCLSSRRNLCIHPDVMREGDREAVDTLCRNMTASWVRQRAQQRPNEPVELCEFYEQYDRTGSDAVMPPGVYSLDDLKEFGAQRGWCPYFLARHVLSHANVIIYNYSYMLDPKIAGMVSRELEQESVVVFDEAHNIDNVCIEALSVTLDKKALQNSSRCLSKLSTRVQEMKRSDAQRLNEEYDRLVRGLTQSGVLTSAPMTDTVLANPVIPSDILEQAVPGNIRKAEHFLGFMKKIIQYLRTQMDKRAVTRETPLAFLHGLYNETALERKPLRFTYSRLNSLLRTLEVTSLDEYNPLTEIANFATLVATYTDGFEVIFEPHGSVISGISEPLLQLSCLDASIAVKPVFDRFQSVIITSGTLSPIELYPKILNFTPVISKQLEMSVFRDCICPLVVVKGSDQVPISSKFDARGDETVLRNYGDLLREVAANCPDGIVCFFTSYQYMEYVVTKWDEMGILQELVQNKLLYLETKDIVETTLALDNYKRACDCGRGAIFFSVARGKIAEGIDFDRHYGRCVMLFGVPYQYTKSHVLNARLEFMRLHYQIKESDFLTFDAIRQAAQCVGRVIRSKTDYGIVILADERYNRFDKRSKFPPWIKNFIRDERLKLSTDVAVDQMRQFLRQLGQPLDRQQLLSSLIDDTKLRQLLGARSRPSGIMTAITSNTVVQPPSSAMLPQQAAPPAAGQIETPMDMEEQSTAATSGVTPMSNGTPDAKRARTEA